MKSTLILLFSLSFSSYGLSNKSNLILSEIQKSIARDFNISNELKIVEEVEYVDKVVAKNKVEIQLDQIRIQAQKKLGLPTDRPLSGKERVELLKEINRQKIKANKEQAQKKGLAKSSNWMDSKIDEQQNWQEKKKAQIKSWEEEKKKILNNWKVDKKRYQKEIPQYKQSLEEIPVPKTKTIKVKQVKKTKIKVENFKDYHVVKGSLDLDIKDQGQRPTCASFAGVRAIEIVLAKQNKNLSLSEQYFYFSSKPQCQTSPCQRGGSWVYNGFMRSKSSGDYDIPLRKSCPYVKTQKSSNDTQIPLATGCQRGVAKLDSFYEVRNHDSILKALKDDHPVVSGFKLSDSFYNNDGYVFSTNQTKLANDSHAKGHAIVLVGYMKLPKSLESKEGRFCYLTANSWGSGWGKGGHACLSERWVDQYRYDIPFLAVSKASAK
ncbi:C1 family peptidase [Halobacteriovorax sp. GB3]|uniref:C1 family peptidase n=1 Tax=Halobacteriovorax sp. GB3 TaxID=2719615 RepID=UPI00235E08DF|nr:C1 family peptidase [Halobacteriovorax sp. GB3]MDD0853737.1 C1 family peptidase [Halobacteriovorax sp. GB3]